jgi:hypothetical protein
MWLRFGHQNVVFHSPFTLDPNARDHKQSQTRPMIMLLFQNSEMLSWSTPAPLREKLQFHDRSGKSLRFHPRRLLLLDETAASSPNVFSSANANLYPLDNPLCYSDCRSFGVRIWLPKIGINPHPPLRKWRSTIYSSSTHPKHSALKDWIQWTGVPVSPSNLYISSALHLMLDLPVSL